MKGGLSLLVKVGRIVAKVIVMLKLVVMAEIEGLIHDDDVDGKSTPDGLSRARV